MNITDLSVQSHMNGYSIFPKGETVMELHVDHTSRVGEVLSNGVYTLSMIQVDTDNDSVAFYTDTKVNILTVSGVAGTQVLNDDIVISESGT